jgi:hypothetical protein
VRFFLLLAICIGLLAGAASPVSAQDYKVGDRVLCDGGQIGKFESGRVIGITPRAGWPDPFYEVQPEGGGSAYKCLPRYMRPGSAAGVPAPTPGTLPAIQPPTAQPPAPAPAALCVPGTRVEVAIGITWYTSTVIGPPTANGRCPIRRDNYDDLNVAMDSLRPAGSGTATTIPKQAGRQAGPGDRPPDGVYACNHMAAMGTSMGAIGSVDVRGGVPTFRGGLPEGWTMRQVKFEGWDAQGRPKVVVDYTSKAGFHDRLDCFPR